MYSPTDGLPAIPEERWGGDHLRETRWQLELCRLLVDPVLRGGGVPRGDGRAVVLLPGFGGGDQTLIVLATWLARIGYRPYTCGFVANTGCSDRALDRVERRVKRLYERHGRRVALIGHSRGGHYARALGHRRPELVSHAISAGAGPAPDARDQLRDPGRRRRGTAGDAPQRPRAVAPLPHRGLRLRVRSRLRRRLSHRSSSPDQYLLEGRRRRPLAGRARPVRRPAWR